MAHAAFHFAEEFITEDLDYYFSGERDKNNQIRPDDNIYSMTPASSHCCFDMRDGRVANFFFPSQPNFFDRIYIGISVPLFANNWGASFLLQLLKVLKPNGAIILPVYPEGQAQEKGYWSRSFLENIFLSRQRWTGFSNVRAENDGVMSLQVGRKWPDPIPSTIEWFYQQRSNIALERIVEAGSSDVLQTTYIGSLKKVWRNYTHSAVIERIILDAFGAKSPLTVHSISDDYGLLMTDLLLSPYVDVMSGLTDDISTEQETIAKNFKSYFAPHMEGRHQILESAPANLDFKQKSNVISLTNALVGLGKSDIEGMLNRAWEQVKPGGLLVVYEDFGSNMHDLNVSDFTSMLEKFGEVQIYSSIVAAKIQENVEISHYSSIQEAKLGEEKRDQIKVYRVVHKAAK
jgi:hypothetical protein